MISLELTGKLGKLDFSLRQIGMRVSNFMVAVLRVMLQVQLISVSFLKTYLDRLAVGSTTQMAMVKVLIRREVKIVMPKSLLILKTPIMELHVV